MKILYSLPKMSDLLKHDSRLMKVVKLCLPAFILISSITVFAGVKIQLSEYLSETSLLTKAGLLSFVYLIFSLAPDVINVVCMAYITRSFLTNRYTKKTDIILIVFCGLLSIGLTKYSYQMSQFSARNVANEASPKLEKVDVSHIDSNFTIQKEKILINFNNEHDKIISSIEDLLTNNRQSLVYQTAPLQERVNDLEKNRKPTNTIWTDKQISGLRKEISTLQQKSTEKDKELLEAKQKAIEELRDRKVVAEQAIENQKEEDRSIAINFDKTVQDNTLKIRKIFTQEFSWIAGKSIFIVLILAIILEVLYFRNEVTPVPIFSQFDFQTSAIHETLALPFVCIGRHLLNKVRGIYANLPDLKEPPKPTKVYNWSTFEQEIKNVNGSISSVNSQVQNTTPENGKNGVYENRIYDQNKDQTKVIQKDVYRECIHCGESFIPNHKKHKYCTADCRKTAWEERTGRTLKLKAKKKN